MDTIKTIIVDDEPLALEVLESYINKTDQLELIGQFNNAIDANNFLKNNTIDLMFLDIQMPQFNGIQFIKSLVNPPQIIFTTAYSQYAVESYELQVADYLVKPIPFERFIKSVNKVSATLKNASTSSIKDKDDFIFVKADKKMVKINYKDIDFIEGLKDYVIINTLDRRIVTLQTMKNLEALLPTNLFKRIHRSFIVSLEKINAISGNTVELKTKTNIKTIAIGKNYKQELVDIINTKKI